MSDLLMLLHQHEIRTVIDALFVAVDRRDWDTVRRCLAPRVHFDVTSLGASAAVDLNAEEIVEAWQNGLARLEAVHHQSGNFFIEVNGSDASCFCYGTAHHYRRVRSGRNMRMFVGSYDFRLGHDGAAWRITQFKFNAKFVEGNLELEKEDGA